MKVLRSVLLVGAVALLGLGLAAQARADSVDTELSLVIDVSGSISDGEFDLQMHGYAQAFRTVGIQNAILSTADGDLGRIAVNVVFFGSDVYNTALQNQVLLDSAADINDFADALDAISRPGSGSTAVGKGMWRAYGTLLGNTYEGTRRIIDVSGDGRENVDSNSYVAWVRDQAELSDMTVNGLAITGSEPGLLNWYTTYVPTSDGQVWEATGFDNFQTAIIAKLGYELGAVPEPGTIVLLGSALAGLAAVRRRRRTA